MFFFKQMEPLNSLIPIPNIKCGQILVLGKEKRKREL